MKFSVGDRVLLRRTGEEGFILAFLSKQMVEVSIGDVSFPVYADELEHPYLKWFTEPKPAKALKGENEIPVEKQASKPVRLSRGIYLSFLPQFAEGTADDIIEAFRIHFLNETAEHLSFTYQARASSGDTLLQLTGALHPFGNIFLHTLSLEEVNQQPRFHWNVAPRDKPDAGLTGVLRIRPAQLVKYISGLLHEGEPSFTVLLAGDAEAIPASPLTIPVPLIKGQVTQREETGTQTEAEIILDLHVDGSRIPEDMPGAQILSMQLSLLERKLDAAYASGIPRMVIIHGIGTGALRDAVHETLRNTPFIERFSNHWMGAYGWGATEVFFRSGD